MLAIKKSTSKDVTAGVLLPQWVHRDRMYLMRCAVATVDSSAWNVLALVVSTRAVRPFQGTGKKVSHKVTIVGTYDVILGGKTIVSFISDGTIIQGGQDALWMAVSLSGIYCLVRGGCIMQYAPSSS